MRKATEKKVIIDRSKYKGHQDFIDLTLRELEMHSKKNSDYAKGGDPLGNFKRVGSILRHYKGLDPSNPVVVAIMYALKQFDACLWMLSQNYEGEVENIEARMADIHVYLKLARILHRENKS